MDCGPSSLNEFHIILGSLIGGNTNHAKKVHFIGLEASQEVFHIILSHGKGKEPRMVKEDLVITKKEAI